MKTRNARKLPARPVSRLLRRATLVPPSLATEETLDASPGGEWVVAYKVETFDEIGDAITVWWASRTMVTSSSDSPDDTLFEGVLAKGSLGTYRLQVFGGGAREAGSVAISGGGLSVVNADGSFDPWIGYLTDGSKVTCYLGKHGDRFPAAWRKVFITYVEGFPEFANDLMTLQFRNRDRLFDKDAVTQVFRNDSGSESGIALERNGIPGGRKQALTIGSPAPWEPILTNDLENIWQLTGPGSAVQDVPSLYDGGVALVNSGGFGTDFPGGYQILEKPSGGGVFAHLTTEVRFGLRCEGHGLRATSEISEREWTVCDFANAAGIATDPTNLPAGTINFSAGNRRLEDQSIRAVLADIAKFEVAAIGLDRLDRFYARRIEPSFVNASVYTLVDGGSVRSGNASGLRVSRLRGAEKRVHTVKARAGRTNGSPLTDPDFVGDAARYDRLSRKPWMTAFTATCWYNTGPPFYQLVLITDVDPTAEVAQVEIEGHEFLDTNGMEAWALRYMKLYGARTTAFSIETDLDFDTLALNLLDTVTLQTTRYGGSRNAIIVSIDVDLSRLRVRFGLWSHDENGTVTGTAAPTAGEIALTQEDLTEGAGGAGAGTGVVGKGDGARQNESFYVNLADKTSAIATGESAQDFIVPYDMMLTALIAQVSTLQTSGTAVTIDVKVNTVSIMGTKITVDNNERSSLTAATPPVISAPALTKGDRMTFHIDGAGTGGKGPSVTVVGYQR